MILVTTVATGLIAAPFGGAFARRDQGAQRGARGSVLDDAATRSARLELAGKREHVDEPVQHVGFQLRTGRARRIDGPEELAGKKA